MTIKVIERKDPRDRTLPRKYYALKVNNGKMGVRKISEFIAEISIVSSIDVMAIIEAFLKLVPESLADGYIVRLGDFGSLFITLKSEETGTEEDFTAAWTNGDSVRFRSGKLFKQVLASTDYVKE